MKSTLIEEIKVAQGTDSHSQQIMIGLEQGMDEIYRIDNESLLRRQNKIAISSVPELRRSLLEKAHASSYAMHPGITKMYHDLRELYWWEGMKRILLSML